VAEREAVVRAYEQSGLTQKAFARREGIKYRDAGLRGLQRRRRKATAAVGPTFAEFTMAVAVWSGSALAGRGGDPGASVEDVAKLLRLVRC
jgi:hypothetical protein